MATKQSIEFVLLDEVDFSPKYNVRSSSTRFTPKHDADLTSDELASASSSASTMGGKTALAGLIASIDGERGSDKGEQPCEGQNDPILIRPNPGKGKKFIAVDGFGRCAAIQWLAQRDKTKAPTIKAEIRQMTEAEAIRHQLVSGVNRADLSPADTVHGVIQLAQKQPKDKKLKTTDLAAMLGISQSWASRLLTIAGRAVDPEAKSGVTQEVLAKWRESFNPPSLHNMVKVAQAEEKDQEKVYSAFIAGKGGGGSETGGDSTDANGWVDKAKSNLEKSAKVFARLVHGGVIAIADQEAFFSEEGITFITKLKVVKGDKENAKARRVLTQFWKDAYTKAMGEAEVAQQSEANKGRNAETAVVN